MSGRNTSSGIQIPFVAYLAVAVWSALFVDSAVVQAQDPNGETTANDSITIWGDFSQDWVEGRAHLTLLRGRCKILQGETVLTAQKMMVWQTSYGRRTHIAVYLEDDVRVERPGVTRSDSSLLIDLVTEAAVTFHVRGQLAGVPADEDAFYRRAWKRKNLSERSLLQQTQYVPPASGEAGATFPGFRIQPAPQSRRRVRIFERSAVPFTFESFQSQDTTPPEQIAVLTGGVNIIIDGVHDYGTVDLSADRIVIWTSSEDLNAEDFSTNFDQSGDTPFQVYLEGNIEIRHEEGVLRASRAFYDVKEDRAFLLDAELKVPIPELRVSLRIRAAKLRQLSRKSFHALQAWMTTSRFGKPGYRLQASDVFLEYRYSTRWLGAGVEAIDPLTGAPVEEIPWVTSLNNTFLIEDVPLLYAPYLSSPADDPGIPLRRATITHDRIFGGQIKTVWNMFKLLGRETPPNITWDGNADYFTDRGPGFGTGGSYEGRDLFGIPGTYVGSGLLYYVHDDGDDNLGLDRRALVPEDNDRYRFQIRHRQNLPYQTTVFGELGLISDRNFLEQYYEYEFDTGKDNETLLSLKQQFDNFAGTLLFRPQLNEFENQTEWLPRGDLYFLGQPLLGGLATWSMHSALGYGRLRPADAPSDPNDVFTPLPFLANVEGGVAMSRHELDLPFDLGPVRFVPFVLGETAYWNEDLTGSDRHRFYANAGLRGNIAFWRVFPHVHSRIFNLRGLAHKMAWESEYSWSDASEGLGTIAQYNEFDDNAQERFRQRLVMNSFGGVLPPIFEPRFYAVRTGAGQSVTAPYYELVDDQQVFRTAWRHRLQTKRGPPERLRIEDWMTLDLEASFFPDSARDNFGEDFGLFSARYAWHVGDRTSLFANAAYDFFSGAQQLWNVGMLSQRSTRGSVYLGARQIKGAGLDSQILTASYSYAMSPKWISTFGTAYDVGENQNRGQSLTLTRVGGDLLVHLGANYDQSKDSAGIAVSIEPLFGPFNSSSTQLSSLLGIR